MSVVEMILDKMACCPQNVNDPILPHPQVEQAMCSYQAHFRAFFLSYASTLFKKTRFFVFCIARE
jgi:hypothetical protein